MKKVKAEKKSSFKRFLWTVLFSLLFIAVAGGLIYWQREAIANFFSNLFTGTAELFGWGIVILALVVCAIVITLFARPRVLFHYWNKWLGVLILCAAVWAVLGCLPGQGDMSYYGMGGQIGQSIAGPNLAVSILIILLLLIVGIFLVIPHQFAGFITGLFRKNKSETYPTPAPVINKGSLPENKPADKPLTEAASGLYPKYHTEPKPRPAQPEPGSKSWLWKKLHPDTAAATTAAAAVAATPEQPRPQSTTAKTIIELRDDPVGQVKTETPAQAEAQADKDKTAESKDTKQAAQEVWKKYGEAGTQTTEDGWKLPPIEILDNTPEVEFSQADNMQKAKLIEEALSSYGVDGKVVQINVGPTVTQFGVEPGWDRKLKEVKEKDKNGDVQVKMEEVSRTRVKVDRITALANDLSLALAAPTIRIEAPVPGKSVVGIEVPNTTIGTVSMRSVVESNLFQKMLVKSRMAVALGKGAGGESVVGDLTKMPHLLIAGATGSGKTVCMHTIICCLLLHNTPGDLRFIMIDPKRVEMTSYNSLPHLATPVIVETNRALLSLRWLAQEMDKRYQVMAAARARNIETYNKARPNEKLPYIVLVVDELADLMMTAGDEVEHTLCRLAQLARAVGIHLIVATQRPSVDVVTGLIKANFPTRISFAVTSLVDSRTILDTGGAEKLLGRGDMLYLPTEASKPKRLQGCFLSDPEIERLVYFWNNQKKETASQLRMEDLVAEEADKLEKPPEDPLLTQARKLMEEHEHISASFLQRHLRIGYPRAARLMEQLEAELGEEPSDSETAIPDEKFDEDYDKDES